MHKIQIEISHENMVFVEEECRINGWTYANFFELLLNSYKEGKDAISCVECGGVEDNTEEFLEDSPKKRGRKKKGS